MVETIALRDIVLRGGTLPEHPDMVVPEPADAANRAPLLPFVGRVRELERLHDAWARAAAGHGSFFLIGGDAGIGKSRLAAELALLAAAKGGRVLRGSTSPGEPAPYQAISEVLRDAVPMVASLDVRSVWLRQPAYSFPELRTLQPASATTARSETRATASVRSAGSNIRCSREAASPPGRA